MEAKQSLQDLERKKNQPAAAAAAARPGATKKPGAARAPAAKKAAPRDNAPMVWSAAELDALEAKGKTEAKKALKALNS